MKAIKNYFKSKIIFISVWVIIAIIYAMFSHLFIIGIGFFLANNASYYLDNPVTEDQESFQS